MSRRRVKRGASWEYATTGAFQLLDDGTNAELADWIFPVGRTAWLCEDRGVDSLTVAGIHLWLDFHWESPPGGAGNSRGIPDVEFFVRKTEAQGLGSSTPQSPVQWHGDPWTEPKFPSTVTSWAGSDEGDGTDPYMWTHWIKGMSPPNAMVSLWDGSNAHTVAWNQTQFIESQVSQGATALVCRTFSVRAEWQPDVIIKTRRRLSKVEGIAITMGTPQAGTGCTLNLDWRARVLIAR